MGLWEFVVLRVAFLSGERIAFHGLGRERHPLATTMVAYGGAAGMLWVFCLVSGHADWVSQAFWPGAVYAVSFSLYTAALTRGPVSQVSGFANATVVMLFLVAPSWNFDVVVALILFVAGSVLLLPRDQPMPMAVLWMLLSDVALVVGRSLDARQSLDVSLPYAASLFTSVTAWLIIPVTLYGLWRSCVQLVLGRPAWSTVSALCNGFSYLTVLTLLKMVSLTVVEAISAWAGVAATILGVFAFREGKAIGVVAGAALMTVGTLILLFSPHGGMR